MQTTIQKWGNSYAVRLPKQLVVELGLRVGSPVCIEQHEERVVVKPVVARDKVTMKDWKKYLIPMKTKRTVHASDRVDEILYGKTHR